MKRRLIIFVFLIFLIACGPYIWFKVPQPQGRENLKIFPSELLGKYVSASDTSIIRIESDKIIKEYRENLLMTRNEFKEETGDTIPEDTSFKFSNDWDIVIKSFGDSVMVYSSCDDELFRISENQILREYKGYYFLNYRDTNDYWMVKILKLRKDTLEFDYILSDNDMQAIKKITSVKTVQDSTDEVNYYLNPSKREIRRILRKRTSGEKYVKLN